MDNVYRKNRKAISELMKIIEKSKDQIPFEVYQDFDKILKEAYSYCVIQSIKADGKEVACHVKKKIWKPRKF